MTDSCEILSITIEYFTVSFDKWR